jgi:DNA-binding MarR family transcriptional regulator
MSPSSPKAGPQEQVVLQSKPQPTNVSGAHRLLASDLATEIEFLAARARSVGTARANEFLAPLDLKVRSYSILALASSGHEPSQRELADFLSLDASQIVALVDELERRGLVSRAADPRDRRSNSIAATTAGLALYRAARDAVRRAESESLGALSVAERDTLRSLLARIAFPAPSS